MAGDVNPIYQRLNGIQDYHPFTANTFADWSLEAGDIVSINRGGTTYSGPTQINTIKWNGQQQVTVEVPGEQTRGSVARMSAETYNGGNGGGNSYRSGYRRNTKEELIGAKIRENADNIKLEAWNREQADNTFEASLKVQADAITAEVKNRKKGDEELSGQIKVEAGKISQIVTAVGRNGEVTAASIMMAINGDKSNIKISADKVYIDGDTTINDIFTVRNNYIFARKPILVSEGSFSTYIDGGTVRTRWVNLTGSGGTAGIMLEARDCEKMIVEAAVKNGTLYLYPKNARSSPITFKKATSLSGEWSGDERGTVADFYYRVDDESIPVGETHIYLSKSGGTVYAKDPAGTTRASLKTFSNSITLEYDSMKQESYSGVTTYTYYYKYTRNSAYRPLGNSKEVWW